MSGEGAWKVAVVPGDGIGPEVVRSALAVLDAAGAKFEQVVVEIGF
ncbi:MAG TPA: isocitrate/isopropylmalate family dehydrogenase, partial [Methanothrix sp.]|nr:isocitrate/isopropylmalate family dehydrogenase [Methanothrix sp.]